MDSAIYAITFKCSKETTVRHSIEGLAEIQFAGVILCMRPANAKQRYIVTSSLIGWAHT